MSEDTKTARAPIKGEIDAVVVGAGFSGMYMLHKLRELGLKAQGFDKASDVGGTWYWNRYPGARCDIPSMSYSYTWSDEVRKEWVWTEKYATQPEILRYARHVADRYDLKKLIAFETSVTSAVFDDESGRWTIKTDRGDEIKARFCIMATGCLSVPRAPKIEGEKDFKGPIYHTGTWPHEGVDFSGLRVAVIGTGSSGIQSIPEIAKQAKHVTVFQRTPNFSVPANNRMLTEQDREVFRANFPNYLRMVKGVAPAQAPSDASTNPQPMRRVQPQPVSKEQLRPRLEAFWADGNGVGWLGFPRMLVDQDVNDAAADFMREKIAARVKDPEIAKKLLPHDHPVGTKRICVDTDYYETYNRENVELVDLRDEELEAITAKGVKTDAKERAFDAIVFATGFDAMTGALLAMDIRSSHCALRDAWEHGPKTYFGLMVAGLPNLFTITGPGSPSVLNNMITAGEHHVEWIAETIKYMREHNLTRIQAKHDAQERWVQHVNDVADHTLFPRGNSWYIGANIPGKPRVFMPYVGLNYRQKVAESVEEGYKGFALS